MRDLRRECRRAGEEQERWDSEMDDGAVPEKGEEQLHKLVAELLRSPKAQSPAPDLVGEIYLATFRYMVRLLAKDAGDREFAQDAAQEAFEKLQKHLQTKKALPDKPMEFLLTVARNFLRKRGRDARRRSAVSLDAVDPKKLDGVAVDHREAAREPVLAIASAEVKEIADTAVDELDKIARKVVELSRKGMDWEPIAKKLKLTSPAVARVLFNRAVHHVTDALAEHFSSYVTTAEFEVRRHIKTRKSAAQAIDLLPPPYDKILTLILVNGVSEEAAAYKLGVSVQEIRRHHKHGAELFQKKYKMTEDELRQALLNDLRR